MDAQGYRSRGGGGIYFPQYKTLSYTFGHAEGLMLYRKSLFQIVNFILKMQ